MSPFDQLAVARAHVAAGRLDDAGAALRLRTAMLDAATAQCGWDGAGARAFRRRADANSRQLHHAGALLDQAAAMLRRHAQRLAEELAARDAAERAALRAVLEQVGRHR